MSIKLPPFADGVNVSVKELLEYRGRSALLDMPSNSQIKSHMAGTLVAKTKGRLMISSPELVYPQTLGIYIKKDNQALISALESAMETITSNGSLPALIEKYELSPFK